MQRLHVVGVTKDHEGLILSARRGTKTGAWTVNVDAEFEEFVAGLLKERGGEAEPRIARAESQLSVREMQQRLRAGQSIRQVARAAGVHDDWVERFAVPIQAEQTQIVRQALDLTFSKQRLGVSSQPLGTSVWWNLQDRSVVLPEDGWENGWTAFLVRDSKWVVRFSYEARKRNQSAEWEVDLRDRSLTSRNRLATELGYVESGRRRRPGPPPPVAGGLLTRAAPPTVEAPPASAPAPVVEEPAPAKPRRASARRPAAKKAADEEDDRQEGERREAAGKEGGSEKGGGKESVREDASSQEDSSQEDSCASVGAEAVRRPPSGAQEVRRTDEGAGLQASNGERRAATGASRSARDLHAAGGGEPAVDAGAGARSGPAAPVASPPLSAQRCRLACGKTPAVLCFLARLRSHCDHPHRTCARDGPRGGTGRGRRHICRTVPLDRAMTSSSDERAASLTRCNSRTATQRDRPTRVERCHRRRR